MIDMVTPSVHSRLVSWGRRVTTAAAVVAIIWLSIHIVIRCLLPLGNSDVFWQVRTGELVLTNGDVPGADLFSYTVFGEPWNNHEWLWEIGAAALYRAFGWGAFRVAILVLWGGTVAAITGSVARHIGLPQAALVLAVLIQTAGYKLKPVPQLASMFVLTACICLFLGPRMLRSRARAAALVLTLLVWGQLTAEALTFLPLLLLDQLFLRFAPSRPGERSTDRTTSLLILFAFLAPMIPTPWSWTVDYAVRGTIVNRTVNNEFFPIWATAAAVRPGAKLIGILVVGLYVPWSLRRMRRARGAPRWEMARLFGLCLLLATRAVMMERDLWLLVFPLAHLLSTALRHRWLAPVSVGLAAALQLYYANTIGWNDGAALRGVTEPRFRKEHINPAVVPTGCMDRLGDVPPGTRVFTLRMWASYLIWKQPQLRVFYDGRNLEYGLELNEAGKTIWEGRPGASAILDETQTDIVVAKEGWNSRHGLVDGPWRQVLTGPNCAVFVRSAELK